MSLKYEVSMWISFRSFDRVGVQRIPAAQEVFKDGCLEIRGFRLSGVGSP